MCLVDVVATPVTGDKPTTQLIGKYGAYEHKDTSRNTATKDSKAGPTRRTDTATKDSIKYLMDNGLIDADMRISSDHLPPLTFEEHEYANWSYGGGKTGTDDSTTDYSSSYNTSSSSCSADPTVGLEERARSRRNKMTAYSSAATTTTTTSASVNPTRISSKTVRSSSVNTTKGRSKAFSTTSTATTSTESDHAPVTKIQTAAMLTNIFKQTGTLEDEK